MNSPRDLRQSLEHICFSGRMISTLLMIFLVCENRKTVINNCCMCSNPSQSMFARHWIPTEVMSDNGPQFSAKYFRKFANKWGLSHTMYSPRYPQANGEAERAVRTVNDPTQQIHTLLLWSIRQHHLPMDAELLMGRKLRTTVPVIPSVLNPGWMDLNCLKKKKRLGERNKENNLIKDTEHMIYHSYILESLWIDDTRRRDCDYVSRVSQIPDGILHRNRSHLVPTLVAPPAGISGVYTGAWTGKQSFYKGTRCSVFR